MSTVQDPFHTQYEVPVSGGRLSVSLAGAPARHADRVVLLVHGITASHLAWRVVARELSAERGTCILAPDLRGRGASASLPGPYGSASHVADLLAVLDYMGARQIHLAGHSMGAYVAARLASEHPERVPSVLLVDGGLPIPVPADADPDELLAKTLGPALERLGQIFTTRDDYISMWRRHPAFADAWNADIEAYVDYDIEPADAHEAVRSVVSGEAVWTDGRELLIDEATRTAAERVRIPVRLLRAPRGLLNDDHPLITRQVLNQFLIAHPATRAETVPDTNHYTILLGTGCGPSHVVSALRDNALAVSSQRPLTAS
jgi:pimeloyl-ACP methyl ester carboxylesterase